MCVTSWLDLDLTFIHAVVTLTFKILFRLYVRKYKVENLVRGTGVQCHGVTLL